MHYKAYAKVNIFLKIVGTRGNYHELVSRFMIVPSLFDTLSFVPKKSKEAFEYGISRNMQTRDVGRFFSR